MMTRWLLRIAMLSEIATGAALSMNTIINAVNWIDPASALLSNTLHYHATHVHGLPGNE